MRPPKKTAGPVAPEPKNRRVIFSRIISCCVERQKPCKKQKLTHFICFFFFFCTTKMSTSNKRKTTTSTRLSKKTKVKRNDVNSTPGKLRFQITGCNEDFQILVPATSSVGLLKSMIAASKGHAVSSQRLFAVPGKSRAGESRGPLLDHELLGDVQAQSQSKDHELFLEISNCKCNWWSSVCNTNLCVPCIRVPQ